MWQAAGILWREDTAISSVEYALMLALIGAALLGACVALGAAMVDRYTEASQTLAGA
ncbi:MAG: hypothetical protein KQJ78_09565 [Deltaproteobacteria bacterium]|nr:hypothetical protein [Deltaproteobacteria bacterium]